MHKNAFKQKKKKLEKLPQRWGFRPQTLIGLRRLGAPPPDPQVVIPITCALVFSKAFVPLNVVTVKKEQKDLEIAIVFCFWPSFLTFNSAQGTLAKATGSNFSACKNYDLYYIILEWRLVGFSPSLPPPPWFKPLVTPLFITNKQKA